MIRDRTAADIEDCTRLLSAIYQLDGYPLALPNDLARFVAPNGVLGAWVAASEGTLLGHVALHDRSWEGVMDVAARALGCDEADVAVVARLFTAPQARRLGIGRSLLEHAAEAARREGRQPILDVATKYTSAVRLYDAAGWRRIGRVRFPMSHGTFAEELVYAAP